VAKLDKLVISTLEGSNEGLMLVEIAERVGQSEKKVYRTLRRLFQKGIIDSENRRYILSNR